MFHAFEARGTPTSHIVFPSLLLGGCSRVVGPAARLEGIAGGVAPILPALSLGTHLVEPRSRRIEPDLVAIGRRLRRAPRGWSLVGRADPGHRHDESD
jgi:hypothetical protein